MRVRDLMSDAKSMAARACQKTLVTAARLIAGYTWPEVMLYYRCTVISVPACVVRPLYIASVGWSPFASEGGTTTLN